MIYEEANTGTSASHTLLYLILIKISAEGATLSPHFTDGEPEAQRS